MVAPYKNKHTKLTPVIDLVMTFALFFATAISTPQSAWAANQCEKIYSSISHYRYLVPSIEIDKWTRLENYHRFHFRHYKSVLFLSDGDRSQDYFHDDEQTMFVSSDIRQTKGIQVVADNNKLPFADNSFDLIILNKGICVCRGHHSCGGIAMQKLAMRQFAEQMLRILNKQRSSLGIFTGFVYHDDYETISHQLWYEVLAELKAKHPTYQFTTLQSPIYQSRAPVFIGFAISPDPWTPLEQQIYQLFP